MVAVEAVGEVVIGQVRSKMMLEIRQQRRKGNNTLP